MNIIVIQIIEHGLSLLHECLDTVFAIFL